MEFPSQIGKYRVVGLIGRGGMGIVYHARDDVLGRSVAVKIMTSDVAANSEVQLRFLREARSVAFLQHPNIVVVHELGEHNGCPFIAMEFLDGDPLDRLIREQTTLTLMEKIQIILQVAKALQYSHHKGVIHRDIKPANIVCLRDGTVKVVDFGIAHITDQTITGTGMVLGTLAYLAPEQLNGEGIDHRTDIFSLGVVLYQLFAGKLPFEGATTAETMMKILTEPSPALPAKGNVYPSELQPIVDKALAKKKHDRYQTCNDLIDGLTRLLKRYELESQLASLEQDKAFTLAPKDDQAPTEPTTEETGARARREQVSNGRHVSLMHVLVGLVAVILIGAGSLLYLRLAKHESKVGVRTSHTDVSPPSGTDSLNTQTDPRSPASKTSNFSSSVDGLNSTSVPAESVKPAVEMRRRIRSANQKGAPTAGEEIPAPTDPIRATTKDMPLDADVRSAIRGAITEGDWHVGRGEYQEAIQTYQDALKLDPANEQLKEKIRTAQSAREAEEQILKQ